MDSNHTRVVSRLIGDRIAAFGVVNTLVKGVARRAVQCTNLMLNLDESAGLDMPGLGVNMAKIIDGWITTPQGFKAAGVHSGVKYHSLDLVMVYSEVPAKAYCAFTSNNVKAAPVQMMMEENSQTLSTVVVNSNNANTLTGHRGIEDVYSMKQAVTAELNNDPREVGVMSTGLTDASWTCTRSAMRYPVLRVPCTSAANRTTCWPRP